MNAPRMIMVAVLLASLCLASGCGTQDRMLGASGGLLFQGVDILTQPGEATPLVVSLQGGDYLQGLEGYLVGFYLVDHQIGQCRTDDDGLAQITFTPDRAGQHVIIAKLEDPDVRKYAVEGVEIVVAAHNPDQPMVIVDLDRTLVKSGFGDVLAGKAEPMAQSRNVMTRLAKDHAVVYLTHRPDMFTEQCKRWIRKFDYPLGPLLTSSLGEFIKGSGAYKSARIEELKKTWPKIEIGIGDKASDAAAYAANGLTSILVLHPDLMKTPEDARRWVRSLRELPESVEAVESWDQVGRILFDKEHFPVAAAIERLTRLGSELEAEALGLTPPKAPAGGEGGAP